MYIGGVTFKNDYYEKKNWNGLRVICLIPLFRI